MKFTIKKQFNNKYHSGKLIGYNGIILHHTAGSNAGDYAVLNGQTSREVSVHFWIPDYADDNKYDSDGNFIIYQFLPLDTKGWHTGTAKDGLGNSYTLGIEIGNLGTMSDKFEMEQLEALDYVIAYIDKQKGKVVPIYSHAEVALPKGRKIDPNPNTFVWLDNYKQHRTYKGSSVNPAPSPAPVIITVPITRYLKYIENDMMRGDDVKAVQQRVGADDDGIFGKNTKAAVQAFQRNHKLSDDGIVGKYTSAALGLVWALPVAASKPKIGRLLYAQKDKYGKWIIRGEDVKLVQQRLGIAVDGIYGNDTKNAVIAYQRNRKLRADGIVGKDTTRSMGFEWVG